MPAYLTHRLRLCVCGLPMMETLAVEALFQATRGMPRKVNRPVHYAHGQRRNREGQDSHRPSMSDPHARRSHHEYTPSYSPLQVPEDWTPEQPLSVYEYLTQAADAVWERYEIELLPPRQTQSQRTHSTQPDLFDPDDERFRSNAKAADNPSSSSTLPSLQSAGAVPLSRSFLLHLDADIAVIAERPEPPALWLVLARDDVRSIARHGEH